MGDNPLIAMRQALPAPSLRISGLDAGHFDDPIRHHGAAVCGALSVGVTSTIAGRERRDGPCTEPAWAIVR